MVSCDFEWKKFGKIKKIDVMDHNFFKKKHTIKHYFTKIESQNFNGFQKKILPQIPVLGCRSNSSGQPHANPWLVFLQSSLRVRSQLFKSFGSHPGAFVGVIGVAGAK